MTTQSLWCGVGVGVPGVLVVVVAGAGIPTGAPICPPPLGSKINS
jgi:hypothetical protein